LGPRGVFAYLSTTFYASSSSNTACVNCPAGDYGDGLACTSCGVGEYSSAGATYCTTASAGFKANAAKTAAVQCLPGTFSTGATDTCTSCDTGYTSSTSGQTACAF
jgi:hypothetical protein